VAVKEIAEDTTRSDRLIELGVPDPPSEPARYVYGELSGEPREKLVIAPGGNHGVERARGR
jgi:hypothetical protein